MEQPSIIRSPDIERKERVPPGQRETDKWPVLHYGPVPRVDLKRWTLSISGMVEHLLKLTYEQFTVLPMVKVLADIHCVTGWSRLNNLWEGVSTSVIKEMAGVSPEAKFVIVHGAAGFTTNLPLADFFQEDVLLALKHNGQPISPDHGAPVRLVVPRLYFWKSAKWVEGLEFTDQDRPGFWESAGYHNHGDPWQEERYGSRM